MSSSGRGWAGRRILKRRPDAHWGATGPDYLSPALRTRRLYMRGGARKTAHSTCYAGCGAGRPRLFRAFRRPASDASGSSVRLPFPRSANQLLVDHFVFPALWPAPPRPVAHRLSRSGAVRQKKRGSPDACLPVLLTLRPFSFAAKSVCGRPPRWSMLTLVLTAPDGSKMLPAAERACRHVLLSACEGQSM